MDDIKAKLIATGTLRNRGFTGPIVSHALYADHVAQINEAGADQIDLTMQEAGRSLAGQAAAALEARERA